MLDIKTDLQEKQPLVVNNGVVESINIKTLIPELKIMAKMIEDLQQENKDLRNVIQKQHYDLELYKKQLNKRLKEYHDILKELTKND